MNRSELAFVEHAYDNGVDAVAAFDAGMRFTYWNAVIEALSGMPRSTVVGRSAYEVFPRMRERGQHDLLESALDGRPRFAAQSFFASESAGNDYEWFVVPFLRDGEVAGAVVVARSRSQRSTLEQRLAEVEQRFKTMADSSPVLLWMSDTDSLCSFFNQTWLSFSGRPLESEIGVGWAEGVHPLDFETCMNTYMEAFSKREPFEMEYRLRRFDGEYRWLLDRGTPRYTPTGEFAGFIGSCVDITDRRQAEEETRALAHRLAESNAHIERLLYATSHDLREPIRVVSSFLELLGRHVGGSLDEQGREYLGHAVDGATQMWATVDGLLQFARAQQGVFEPVDTELSEVVDSAAARLAVALDEAGAEIEVGELPTVRADPGRMESLFLNLIGNAAKFRGEAPPRIRVSADRRGEAWVVAVTDNGVGFDMTFAEKVFDMFERLHPRERFPGTGMGLAVVKEVVRLHGGDVWVQSAPGEGSTFFFSLPDRA